MLASVFYEKEDFENSPSSKDGIDFKTEDQYRSETGTFIVEMWRKMELHYNTMATAVVFFQRFYMVHSFKYFPRFLTACSCLILAGKVEETPKRSGDIYVAAREVLSTWKERRDPKIELGENLISFKEGLFRFESVLLHTLDFEFEVEHPYKYIRKYAKHLIASKSKLNSLAQHAWNLINDSFTTTLCIEWEPEVIAIAVLHLSTKIVKLDVKDWKGRKPKHQNWWDLFIDDFDQEILKDICNRILDLYPQTKLPSTLDSPSSISSNEAQINSSTSSPTDSVSNTSNDTNISIVSSTSDFAHSTENTSMYISKTPPSVDFSVPLPVDFSVPPPVDSLPNLTVRPPSILPPFTYNIPPPFPIFNPLMNFQFFPPTPNSPSNNPSYYLPHS